MKFYLTNDTETRRKLLKTAFETGENAVAFLNKVKTAFACLIISFSILFKQV